MGVPARRVSGSRRGAGVLLLAPGRRLGSSDGSGRSLTGPVDHDRFTLAAAPPTRGGDLQADDLGVPGRFPLAAAGLPGGRRAATHWRNCQELAAQFPQVSVVADGVYVRERNVWTSAGPLRRHRPGAGAGPRDRGAPAAVAVASVGHVSPTIRRSPAVLGDARRPGARQRAPSRTCSPGCPIKPRQGPPCPNTGPPATSQSGSFRRTFKAQLGVTAGEHFEGVRLEPACRLLDEPWPRHYSRRAPTPLRCCRCGCHPG